MIDLRTLIGLDIAEAVSRLTAASVPWCKRTYAQPRGPIEGADSVRVVRATHSPSGVVELITCDFRTTISQEESAEK